MDDAAYSTEAECFLCPEFRGERYSPLVFRQPAPGMLTVSAVRTPPLPSRVQALELQT